MSICVAQDLAVVPMILVLPLLASGMGGGDHAALDDALWQVGKSFLLLLVAMGAAWLIVPRLLDLVSKTRSREVFVLSIFTLCLTGATITAMLGLSLALGAFLIGLILAESDYHHQATAEVEPFRDALSSLFFVSIGMLFDPSVIVERPEAVSLALAAVVVGKAVIVWIAAKALALPGWVGLRTGLLMAQVGEFSFVVIQVARGNALELGSIESVFIVVAVMSIGLTPLMMLLGRRLTQRGAKAAGGAVADGRDPRRNHVIIVGFGPGGRAVAHALRNQEIPFVVIEMNAETVKEWKQRKYPIFLGDASREAVLRAAGLMRARLLVLATNDTEATRHTAALARRIAPDIRIIARTSYISEVPILHRLGVQEIVPQELETSIEIMVRVLQHYLVPNNEIGREVHAVREGVKMPERSRRPKDQEVHRLADFLPGVAVDVFCVAEASAIAGRTLLESDLRRLSDCTVVAIKRGSDVDIAVRADSVLQVGDIAVLIGPKHRIAEAAYLFDAPRDAGSQPGVTAEEGSTLIG